MSALLEKSFGIAGQEKPRTGSCRLPDNVHQVILSYLPAKTFFRLQSVCKSFHQLSEESHFLLSQSYLCKVVSGFFTKSYSSFDSFLHVDPCAGVPRTFGKFLSKNNGFILGSADGLVFVRHDNRRATTHSLFVYNPARRTRCHLPAPSDMCLEGGIAAVTFMNDGEKVMKDYKLVYLSPTSEWNSFRRCQVYDSVAKMWTMDKHLDFGGAAIDLDHPVVYDETIFWVSTPRPLVMINRYVVAFDLRTKCTQIIRPPERMNIDRSDTIGIGKWEGKSVCLIHYRKSSRVFALELLEKSGNGAIRWVTVHEASLDRMGFKERLTVSFTMLCEVATTTLLVFATLEDAYTYSIKDGEIKKLGPLRSWITSLIPYSNTLRPCGEEEELFETT
ncbi:unnamed protein product [Musa acuminata subsp. malaccensis]|uniref:(wild Malaysian banana) hypothetical protein n=1 Tax=Musa acuminata subsp. malaccensis TaxID=214687 RepID=A0A804I8S9_MUSAM|nr:PREDICTED: uncharacterized protein LOC103977329 [Musa acuminata subsp. malaccensis]CAG1849256.1 unnamed protein product [Musa acuminata subsp. malaccensis]CAG1849258.1 unnamed protein product [Musa acuminata subsp. malaccensis]